MRSITKNRPLAGMLRILCLVPGTIYAVAALLAFFGLACDWNALWQGERFTFLTIGNIINIIEQSTILAVIAIASLMAIITRGVDLSLGATMSFAGVVAAYLVRIRGWDMPQASLTALAAGLGVGMLNGLLIASHNVAPFIITLGTMNVAKSLALVVSNSRTISANTPSFRWLGGGVLCYIPYTAFLMLAIYMVFDLLMRKRRLGTYIYAIGGNEAATHLSGINVRRTKFLTFILTGLLAAVAGIMLASRLGAANPGQGDGYEFYGIAAAVVGGASMTGGHGSVWLTLTGALIISILRNGLNMAGLPVSLQMIILGFIIVGVVTFDTLSRRRK